MGVKTILEEKLGESLEEIDEYLHAYRFGPETLLSLVEYFVNAGQRSEKSLEEIAGEVDGFLYTYAETGSVSLNTFVNLFKVILQITALLLFGKFLDEGSMPVDI